jgi:hypothetical protein
MSSVDPLKEALRRAAEKILSRPLNTKEADDLYKDFQTATGTEREKADKALARATKLTEKEASQRASDNTDRVMQDLQNVIDSRKPKP